MAEEKTRNTVYVTLPKAFVKTDIPYTTKDGEEKTFNSVTLPKGTRIGDAEVGGYQFSPLYVNSPSRYRGDNAVDIPLLADRDVTLMKDMLDENSKPVFDENGKKLKLAPVVCSPAELKEAVQTEMNEWRKEHAQSREKGKEGVSLADAGQEATIASEAAGTKTSRDEQSLSK